MLDSRQVVSVFQTLGMTHIVWLPDSHLGTWEAELVAHPTLKLIRATREGEAIALAAGLWLGGAKPLVVMQCTGFFEAGDAFRNVVHDLKIPLPLIVGVRSYTAFVQGRSADTCPQFTEPIVRAWNVPYIWIDPTRDTAPMLLDTLRRFQSERTVGVVLWAE